MRYNSADDNTAYRRYSHCEQRVFNAARFLFNRQAGGRAGKVQHCHYYHANSGRNGPAVCGEQRIQLFISAVIAHSSACHVRHHYYRYDCFIGGKAQNERHYNNAVQPDKFAERVEKVGAVF